MQLTDKARASLTKVIEQFNTGNIGPMVEAVLIELPPDAPAARWTYRNRLLAAGQSQGEADNRGFNQWREVNRRVKKGASASFIFKPYTRKERNKKTGQDEQVFIGWTSIAVFPYSMTEPLEEAAGAVLTYEPKTPPPLRWLVEKWGMQAIFAPLQDVIGVHVRGQVIKTSGSIGTFFHELGHAAHYRIDREAFAVASDLEKETVAGIIAAVLCRLYAPEYDYSGEAWYRISDLGYRDPADAVMKVLALIEKVLAEIMGEVETHEMALAE